MNCHLGDVRFLFSYDRVAYSCLESHSCFLPLGLGRDRVVEREERLRR
jgi:hypothetical protein